MTKIAADTPCERCGGQLVPPELLVPLPIGSDSVTARPDYVCVKCGQSYRWIDNPHRLTTIS